MIKAEAKLDLTASIKRLKLETSRMVNTRLVGNYKSVFRGRGLEFRDYRVYSQDDDASTIDWKASVKSNNLLIKDFVEERNLNVFFLIDVSSSMIYSTIDKLKIEYAAELAVTLSYTILQAGDNVSFALFNDKIIMHSPSSNGMKQHYKFMKALVDTENYGGKYDLAQALKFALVLLKEFSIVIVISDFIGLKNDWEQYLKMVSKKFDLIGIMISDPIEIELPDYQGQVILGDSFSDRQTLVNIQSIRDKYKKDGELRQKMLNEVFTNAKSDFLTLTTDKPFIKPIIDLFLRRASQHR